MTGSDFKSIDYLKWFGLTWAAVITVHALLLYFIFGLSTKESITDSLVFNLVFALAGYLLWFTVRYNLKEKSSIFDIVTHNLLAAVFIVGAWFVISYYTLITIFHQNEEYLRFLTGSIPFRIVTGFFYYIVYVLIYYLIMYYDNLQEKLKRETELQNHIKEAELDALKSQINPHFLFNSLNSISSLTISAPAKAQEMVIKLSDFLRYSLSGDRQSMTPFKNEINNILRYLDIEKVRFGKRLKFISKIEEKCYDVKVPGLILQPLMENAIKHGVYNSSDEVKIILECENKDEFILIKISNDFDPEAIRKKGEGIGLKNIKVRLKLIYHRDDLLKINSENNVFTAILKIPKTWDYENKNGNN